MEGSSFRDLRVWQQAIELALLIYRSSEAFPKHEVYGLSQQMRRAAVSVASNIAEGKGHRSDKEFRHFLFHARGSLMELETQIFTCWQATISVCRTIDTSARHGHTGGPKSEWTHKLPQLARRMIRVETRGRPMTDDRSSTSCLFGSR